ncbi:hypothetical protein TYRP_000592 [Tyrophagus putrescentiae]|nr:hypothetical protein TYRP_000592 [Tyrophagus putrescentiae]
MLFIDLDWTMHCTRTEEPLEDPLPTSIGGDLVVTRTLFSFFGNFTAKASRLKRLKRESLGKLGERHSKFLHRRLRVAAGNGGRLLGAHAAFLGDDGALAGEWKCKGVAAIAATAVVVVAAVCRRHRGHIEADKVRLQQTKVRLLSIAPLGHVQSMLQVVVPADVVGLFEYVAALVVVVEVQVLLDALALAQRFVLQQLVGGLDVVVVIH